MYEEVIIRWKNKNKLLFTRDSPSLQELMNTIRLSTHQALVLWAFKCVKPIIEDLKTRHDVDSLDNAFFLVEQWAKGEVKMGLAKKAILDVHSLAKTTSNIIDQALFHAVGQGLAVVHVETHSIGLVIYELTAMVFKQGCSSIDSVVTDKIKIYIDILKKCEKNTNNYKWASFLDKPKENKEMRLHIKNGFEKNIK